MDGRVMHAFFDELTKTAGNPVASPSPFGSTPKPPSNPLSTKKQGTNFSVVHTRGSNAGTPPSAAEVAAPPMVS